MKVCQILASNGLGGLEKHVNELCHAMATQAEIVAIVPPDMASQFDPSIKVISLPLTGSRYNPWIWLKLAHSLRTERCDIIHAQANKAVTLLQRIAPWVGGIHIGTLHNQKSKTDMFRSLDHAIAVSYGIARCLPSDLPTTVIYNGIADPLPSKLTREKLIQIMDLSSNCPILLAVGRLVPAKGFDLLIQAIGTLSVNLLIVGEGIEYHRLDKLIRTHASNAIIRLGGSRNDVPDIMQIVDGLVISSRNEGFSYVFAEALRAKLPVISTKVNDVENWIPMDLIIDYGNKDMLRETISRNITDIPRWKSAMKPAFARAQTELTINQMARRTFSLYEKLLSTSG